MSIYLSWLFGSGFEYYCGCCDSTTLLLSSFSRSSYRRSYLGYCRGRNCNFGSSSRRLRGYSRSSEHGTCRFEYAAYCYSPRYYGEYSGSYRRRWFGQTCLGCDSSSSQTL